MIFASIYHDFFVCFRKTSYICTQNMNKNMRKILITSVMALTAWVMLVGCATAEERAARAAEHAKAVKTALQERNYQIAVNRMYPSRGASKTVSSGYTVEVRNDSLISYLPYFGRAYDVPYGGGNGLNFSAPIRNYKESQTKSDLRHIEIDVKNDEDTYLYTLDIFDNGSTDINVRSRQREPISFSGQMEFRSK